jgi:hypothetical protein
VLWLKENKPGHPIFRRSRLTQLSEEAPHDEFIQTSRPWVFVVLELRTLVRSVLQPFNPTAFLDIVCEIAA